MPQHVLLKLGLRWGRGHGVRGPLEAEGKRCASS